MRKQIPFNDLTRSVESQRDQLEGAMRRVLDSGWFILGPEHEALESELAEYLGVTNVVNVANGTDALELALAAVGVESGDQVVTVANAGAYTSTATLLLGAEPVYCDVDENTFLMSASTLENTLKALDEKPQAIVVTHLYGAVAPMGEILAVARTHGIAVVEDCAQSLGASIDGKMAGSYGDIATTSFYPTKNLGALGDGGAVFTNNAELAQKVRWMRQYGWGSKYSIEHVHGRNSRLDEIQAAVLRLKLEFLDTQNERRRVIHAAYEEVHNERIKVLNRSSESFIAHLAVIVTDDRTRLRAHLEGENIRTEIHYPIPDHRQQFPNFVPRATPLEVTEWACDRVLSLPLFPELDDSEVRTVVEALGSV